MSTPSRAAQDQPKHQAKSTVGGDVEGCRSRLPPPPSGVPHYRIESMPGSKASSRVTFPFGSEVFPGQRPQMSFSPPPDSMQNHTPSM
ncbi:hypothetical protein Tco_0373368 [Tanacetum coccineum]